MGLLTLTTLVVIGYGLVTRRWMTCLALGAATPAGAAVVIGALNVPTFYAVAGAAAISLAVDGLRGALRGTPGSPALRDIPGGWLLVALFVWSTALTFIAPFFFDGTLLYLPFQRILTPGVVTTSNIAQIVYLLIDVAIVVVATRARDARPQALGLAVGLAMTLSFWRYLSQTYGLPFPEGVFDNSTAFTYIETAPGGIPRFRGIFPEPSGLAVEAVAAIAYAFFRFPQVRGIRRWGCLALIAACLFMGFTSTSASFVVGLALLATIVVVVRTASFLARRVRMQLSGALIACGAVVVLALALPALFAAFDATVQEKVGGDSYAARSGTDEGMIATIFSSVGVGVGLGSSRGSSFVLTQLAAIGVIGTVLFFAAMAVILVRSQRDPLMTPVVWSLVGVMVVKVIGGPEISEPNGLLWICLSLLAAAGVRASARSGGRAPTDLPPLADLPPAGRASSTIR